MNRWVRLGLQTAVGIALLILWIRTVSLTDVASHIRVQRWWVLPLMVLIFVITSVMRARRWQWLLRSLAPVWMVRAFAMNAAGGAGRAARGSDGAGALAGRVHLHPAVRGGGRRRADLEGNGGVPGAAAELCRAGRSRLPWHPRGGGLARAGRRARPGARGRRRRYRRLSRCHGGLRAGPGTARLSARRRAAQGDRRRASEGRGFPLRPHVLPRRRTDRGPGGARG